MVELPARGPDRGSGVWSSAVCCTLLPPVAPTWMPGPVTIPRSETQDREPRTGQRKGPPTNRKHICRWRNSDDDQFVGCFGEFPAFPPENGNRLPGTPATPATPPTPNANRPDRESLVRRQAHWAGYTIIGCCCYCHHFIIVVVSSSAMPVVV